MVTRIPRPFPCNRRDCESCRSQLLRDLRDLKSQALAERVGYPGVSAVETGIALRVTLDLPGMAEPASAQINSLPDRSEARLNRLYSRVGHMLGAGSQHEILVGEAFADAHGLKPGDALSAILNGCTVPLRVAGIGLRRSGRKNDRRSATRIGLRCGWARFFNGEARGIFSRLRMVGRACVRSGCAGRTAPSRRYSKE